MWLGLVVCDDILVKMVLVWERGMIVEGLVFVYLVCFVVVGVFVFVFGSFVFFVVVIMLFLFLVEVFLGIFVEGIFFGLFVFLDSSFGDLCVLRLLFLIFKVVKFLFKFKESIFVWCVLVLFIFIKGFIGVVVFLLFCVMLFFDFGIYRFLLCFIGDVLLGIFEDDDIDIGCWRLNDVVFWVLCVGVIDDDLVLFFLLFVCILRLIM